MENRRKQTSTKNRVCTDFLVPTRNVGTSVTSSLSTIIIVYANIPHLPGHVDG
jgi:hypothetical protein